MFKFTSKSQVAINVVLPGGTNVHVSFLEMTGGGGVYYTNNADLANALRQHHKFGKLFKEVAVEEKPVTKKKAPAAKPAEDGTTQDQTGSGIKEMEFKNVEDAKDYLAERYGFSRSKMKTRGAIEEIAKTEGIKVNWI